MHKINNKLAALFLLSMLCIKCSEKKNTEVKAPVETLIQEDQDTLSSQVKTKAKRKHPNPSVL